MNFVVPMAGRGNRFLEKGEKTPKPLIPVRGRPMYSWAVDSLPLSADDRLIFVCLAEHLSARALENDIRARYGRFRPTVVPLEKTTEGQACTVLAAREFIDNAEPLIIYNADTYCRTALKDRLTALPPAVAGLIGVFRAPGDKWSFARTDGNGRVLETAEKKRISDWATTGLYHFTRGADFVRHADAMVSAGERTNGEFYVIPVYNRLIAEGADIRTDEALEVWVLGTPEDLEHFQKNSPP